MHSPSLVFRGLVSCLLFCAPALPLSATNYTVSSVADFNSLPTTLQAGDTVEITGGTYAGLNTKIFRGTGTAGAPIVIYANPLGGAKFEGKASFVLDGEHITLAGLVFDGNGSPSTGDGVFIFNDNSRNCRITNCRIHDFDDGFTYGPWVFMEGYENRFDHNTLEGKVSGNTTIFVKPDPSNENDPNTKRLHRIDHNYFGPRTVIGPNGYEAIRVSDSSRQGYDMSITVERNYFYQTIVSSAGGEPEVISNKSKGNIYRHNTFRDCDGQLTLRHGDACLVEGNFFFGTGGDRESGVRIIGEDHIVRNNYFENIGGTGLRASLVLMMGDSDWPSSDISTGYETPHNALIANNTFINCEVPINLGEDKSDNVSPTGTRVINNLVQSDSSGSDVINLQMSASAVSFDGNIVYHPDGTYGATGLNGVTYGVDPNHGLSGSLGYFVPGASSNSVDAGSSYSPATTSDAIGKIRSDGNIDVGALEYGATGAAIGEPLVRGDVGPSYDLGPAGSFTAPGAADTTPMLTTTSFPNASVNVAYSATAAATQGNAPISFTLSSGSLPGGLSLNTATGEISGTATAAGVATFTLRVTDADGDFDEDNFSLTAEVVDLFPTVATTSLAGVHYNDYYSLGLVVDGGDAPFTWSSAGNLPTGIQLGPDGVFFGRLREVGVFNFVVTVTDADGDTDHQGLSLTVTDSSVGFGSYLEAGGQVVMEAEGYTSKSAGVGKSWDEVTVSGASGAAVDNALQALPNSGNREDLPGEGPSVSYQVLISNADDYVVHVRAQGLDGSSDSLFVTVDGNTSNFRSLNLSRNQWDWERSTSTFALDAGVHTIDIWMREPGAMIDKIVLNQSTTNQSGTGPAVSADPVYPLTFVSWKNDLLGADNQPDSADPDGDGYTLIEEYYLGLDPTVVDAPGARLSLDASADGAVVGFRYNADASDLRVIVEASDDLINWSTVLVDSNLAPLPPLNNGWAYVSEVDPTPETPRFFRVGFGLQ
ncbi:MAG: chondroitinase-B domain-containing protein [Verrucomicrobiaceae bacterium]